MMQKQDLGTNLYGKEAFQKFVEHPFNKPKQIGDKIEFWSNYETRNSWEEIIGLIKTTKGKYLGKYELIKKVREDSLPYMICDGLRTSNDIAYQYEYWKAINIENKNERIIPVRCIYNTGLFHGGENLYSTKSDQSFETRRDNFEIIKGWGDCF